MERPSWAPTDIDLTQPAASRVYDYYLGGSHNFAVDRELAERAIAVYPNLTESIHQNRAFLRRAVRYLAKQGVTQFIDIGSGIPTVGNTHEVALATNPDSRIVYVDIDPVAVAHSQAILANEERAIIIAKDLHEPEQLLADPELNRFIDLSKPVAVLVILVVHFFSDEEDPWGILARIRELVAPGSYLALSSGSTDSDTKGTNRLMDVYAKSPNPLTFRPGNELKRMFDGWELVEPGMVRIPLWRPLSLEDVGEEAEEYPGYAGVAIKP